MDESESRRRVASAYGAADMITEHKRGACKKGCKKEEERGKE
jgi:hypothetical protein